MRRRRLTAHLDRLPRGRYRAGAAADRRRIAFWAARSATSNRRSGHVLLACGPRCGRSERLLLGAALVTHPAVLVAAYDDAAGCGSSTATCSTCSTASCMRTSRSTRSPTSHTGTRSGVDRDAAARQRPMAVTVRDLGLVVEFAAREGGRTYDLGQFRLDGLAAELAAAHLLLERTWSTRRERFALIVAVAA